MSQDKNYYLNSTINNSGIAETYNPANIDDTPEYRYISKPVNLGKSSPLNINVGASFTKDSKYDPYLGNVSTALEQGLTIEDLRAEKQSGWDMLGNALVNNVVIAGTTMVSSSIGFVNGLFSALAEQDISKLWDNSTNQWATNAQEWSRENFPIYRGQDYEDMSLWERAGTGIFWADMIQNLGYAEGMMLPGKAVGALLSNAPKVLQKTLPSLVGSMGEASIEAINKKNDNIERNIAELNNTYSQLMQTAETPFAQGQLMLEYQEGLESIEKDAVNAGNFIYGSNIAFLTMTNALEWGNTLSRGFKTGQKIRGGIKRKGDLYGTTSLAWDMTKAVGKNIGRSAMEGFEEFGQMVIEKTPDYYTDYNEFNKSKFNRNKRELTSDMWQSLMMGYSETMNDPEMSTAVAQGFLTGIIGIPSIRMSKIPVNLEGNIATELYNTYKDNKSNTALVEAINKRLNEDAKIKEYYDGVVRHMSIQDDMNKFLEGGDEFNYKNAESAQFISDIIMFDNVGDLQRLEEIIAQSALIDYETYKKTGEVISTVTDEEISELINNTTNKEGFGPFVRTSVSKNAKGENVTTTQPMSTTEVRDILKRRFTDLSSMIENYKNIKESLETAFPNLDNESLSNAIFLQNQSTALNERFEDVLDQTYNRVKKLFNSDNIQVSNDELDIIGYKDDNTPIYAPKKAEHKYSSLTKNEFVNLLFGKETSKDMLSDIQEMLDNPKSKLSPSEKNNILMSILDIKRLSGASTKLNTQLQSVLTDTKKSKEDAVNLEEEVIEENTKQEAQSAAKSLSNATSMKEFKEIYNSIDNVEARKNALDIEKAKGSKLAKDFEKIYNYKYQVNQQIDKGNYSDELKADLKKILDYVIDNIDSIEDFTNINTTFNRTLIPALKEAKNAEGTLLFSNKDNVFFRDVAVLLRDIFNNVSNIQNNLANAQPLPTPKVEEKSSDTGQSEVQTAEQGLSNKDIPPQPETVIIGGVDSTSEEDQNAASTNQDPILNEDVNDEAQEADAANEGTSESSELIVTAIPEYEFNKNLPNGYIEFPEKEGKEGYRDTWNYLKEQGAFDFVNKGDLANNTKVERVDPRDPKSAAKIYFVYDFKFNEEYMKGFQTPIFMAVKLGTKYQIVGVVPSKSEVYKYLKSTNEMSTSTVENVKENSLELISINKTPFTTEVHQILQGKAPYDNTSRDLNQSEGMPKTLGESNATPILGIATSETTIEGNIPTNRVIKTPQKTRIGRVYMFIPNASGILSPIVLRTKTYNELLNDNNNTLDGNPILKRIKGIITKYVDGFIEDAELKEADSSKYQDTIQSFVKELNNYLYLPKNVKVFFDGKKIRIYEVKLDANNEFIKDANGKLSKVEGKDKIINIVQYVERKTEIEGITLVETEFESISKDKIINNILEALKTFNFRIQVNKESLSKDEFIRELYNSNIFTTNVSRMEIVGSFFSIPKYDKKGHKVSTDSSDIPVPEKLPESNTNNSLEGKSITQIPGTSYGYYIETKVIGSKKVPQIYLVNTEDPSKGPVQFQTNTTQTDITEWVKTLLAGMHKAYDKVNEYSLNSNISYNSTQSNKEAILNAFTEGLKIYLDYVTTSKDIKTANPDLLNAIKSLYPSENTINNTPPTDINSLFGSGEDTYLLRKTEESITNLMDKEQELAWINKVLPQLSKEDRIKFVEGLIDVASKGTKAWGMFDGSIITLSDIAAEGTLYHEAFHAVFHLILDDNRRQALLKEAAKEYSNKDSVSLEEDLAEAFREFIMMGGKDTRSLGQKILDFFKNLAIKIFNWDKFSPSKYYYFKNINDGKYATYNFNQAENNNIRYSKEGYTPEMQAIKDETIANGTFMKAPNGKPSNLNERQWIHVRTKSFKNWFGDWINDPKNASKVVDENGEPMVVYHSSSVENINIFMPSFSKFGFGAGVFFSDNEKYAKFVSNSTVVYRVFLNIKNPIYTNDLEREKTANLFLLEEPHSIQEWVEKFGTEEGYTEYVNSIEQRDGIIGKDAEKPIQYRDTLEYVVRNPNQIKSATDNIGSYSTENDNIYYREISETDKAVTSRPSDEVSIIPLQQYKQAQSNMVNSFESLPKITQEELIQNNWTAEEFDALYKEEQEAVLNCLGAY